MPGAFTYLRYVVLITGLGAFRNTQSSGLTRFLGFRDNQEFAFSGYSFNKTPLMAFEVNLILNSYKQP